MTRTNQEADLISEEVQEIMNHISPWIVRWGITLLFTIVLIVLTGAYFFRYPVVVKARITVTTSEPPATIIARSSGKLDQIFVRNLQHVENGSPLAIIQNTAATSDIMELSEALKLIESNHFTPIQVEHLFKDKSYNLGEVQSTFNSLLKSSSEFVNFYRLNYHKQKISSQTEQLQIQDDYYNELKRQLPLVLKSYKLSQQVFRRDSVLHAQRVSSPSEFEKSIQLSIQNKRTYLNFISSLQQQKLLIIKQKEDIANLENESSELQNRYLNSFRNSLKEVIAQVNIWEKNYLMVSPIKGKVNLMGAWSKNQNVKTGEAVFTVAPEGIVKTTGRALLPIQGAGKVKVGQLVNIRIDNFPNQEFGHLKGKIKGISNTSTEDGFYIVEIELINGMKTNYGKFLPIDQEQIGTAEIIVENTRLLERILLPLKDVLYQQSDEMGSS